SDPTIKKRTGERMAFKVFAMVMLRPRLYEFSAKFARLFQRLIVRQDRIGRVGRIISRLMPPLGAWTKARDLRPLADKSFREQWRSVDFNP
ncbi:MAG: lactate utilization protein LutB domain-containing protein, partial [Pyrinomonadaceae bacterium]